MFDCSIYMYLCNQAAPLPYFHASWRALCEGPGVGTVAPSIKLTVTMGLYESEKQERSEKKTARQLALQSSKILWGIYTLLIPSIFVWSNIQMVPACCPSAFHIYFCPHFSVNRARSDFWIRCHGIPRQVSVDWSFSPGLVSNQPKYISSHMWFATCVPQNAPAGSSNHGGSVKAHHDETNKVTCYIL